MIAPTERLVDVACYGGSLWHEIAEANTAVFDEIEGSTSLYRCNSLAALGNAVDGIKLPMSEEAAVRYSLNKINGNIVLWPFQFLQREDVFAK